MENMNIQANCGNYLKKRNKCPSFKGAVSPKFVNYVNELRSDCLHAVPECSYKLINNVCDNILNRVQRIMKNCFPESYILTIDTKRFGNLDMIIMDNNGVLKEYIPDGINCGMISKNEFATPISRLICLKDLAGGINGKNYIFSDGYAKSLAPIIFQPYNPKFADLMKWWKDKINLLRTESSHYFQFKNCEELCDEYLSQAK